MKEGRRFAGSGLRHLGPDSGLSGEGEPSQQYPGDQTDAEAGRCRSCWPFPDSLHNALPRSFKSLATAFGVSMGAASHLTDAGFHRLDHTFGPGLRDMRSVLGDQGQFVGGLPQGVGLAGWCDFRGDGAESHARHRLLPTGAFRITTALGAL